MAILRVRDLTKSFVPPRVVVDHISFDLERGETLGILGVNGAGKTTTISMLTGLLTPTAGTITYFGKDLHAHRSEILARIGTASAYAELPTKLTIWQNLDIFGRLYGLNRAVSTEQITYLLDKLDMLQMKNRRCAGLSAGETTRVILAKAFLHNPDIVLLDEPTASLDVDIAKKIRQFVNERRKQGASFIITSHNMQEMTELCDRILVLHAGRIVTVSTPTELAKSVHKTRVQLMVGEQVHACVTLAQEQKIACKVDHAFVTFEVDEHDIARLLTQLAHRAINYEAITIQHPTLEDYFLELKTGG